MEVKENVHFLAENKPEIGDTGSYLHSGVAMRSCERLFQLADRVQVVSASHIDGMLHVDLKTEVTEALKARRIDILQLQGNEIAETANNQLYVIQAWRGCYFFLLGQPRQSSDLICGQSHDD